MADSVRIACAKCGGPYNGGLACPKCGGGFAKVCGQCQFQNSLQKSFCDKCGAPLTISPEQAAAQMDAPQGGPPKTEIRSIPAPAAPPAAAASPSFPAAGSSSSFPAAGSSSSFPAAGRADQSFTPVPTPSPEEAKAPTTTRRRAPSRGPMLPGGIGYLFRSVVSILFLLAVAAAGYMFWLQWAMANRPEAIALRLGEEFLSAMARNDYANAHYMLTEDAKATCPLPDFRLQLEPKPWSWGDLKALKAEYGWAPLTYTVTVEGKRPETASLFFKLEGTKEEPRWALAYTEHLVRKAEELLEANNPDMALLQAGAALRINPRDPAAQVVVCRIQRFRRDPGAQAACARAAELSTAYPGALSSARSSALTKGS